METLDAMVEHELKQLKTYKPAPCIVCQTTKQGQRWSTVEDIVCKDCYLKAISIGVRALKAQG